jgi:uncharacterized membrane protein
VIPITNSSGSLFVSEHLKGDMNLKRVFGIILTLLGIVGLIYAAFIFIDGAGASKQIKTLIVYGILGAIFFFTGIGLIRDTRDDARPPLH